MEEVAARYNISFNRFDPFAEARTAAQVASKNLHLIDVNDVIYGYVKDGLVFIVTKDAQDLVAYRTLEEFASELDPDVFHRVHRSYLTSVEHIREIIPLPSGNYELVMSDTAQTHSAVETARQGTAAHLQVVTAGCTLEAAGGRARV